VFAGAPAVATGDHESLAGTYRPPPLNGAGFPDRTPPKMIISDPVHTAACSSRSVGTLAPVDVGVHSEVRGLNRPPVFVLGLPPHTIISLPLQTVL
jgi:hypothetical protein